MSTRIKITSKAPEGNRESSVSKTNFSRSKSSPVEQILHLQRTIGNHAVQKLFKSGVIQAKLKKLARLYEELSNFAEIKYGTRWGVVSTRDEDKEERRQFALVDAEEEKKKVEKATKEIEKVLSSIK